MYHLYLYLISKLQLTPLLDNRVKMTSKRHNLLARHEKVQDKQDKVLQMSFICYFIIIYHNNIGFVQSMQTHSPKKTEMCFLTENVLFFSLQLELC